jgi:hypothetical protein
MRTFDSVRGGVLTGSQQTTALRGGFPERDDDWLLAVMYGTLLFSPAAERS